MWNLRELEQDDVDRLSGALGVHPATARCLLARGFDEAAAREFLDPRLSALRPPHGLVDLDVAVARIVKALRARERIGVFGDYDVDGVTACALLSGFLRAAGGAPAPRVASRHAGYGFGLADVAHFAEQGCSLIITADCGTSDVAAIAQARSLGIDVIVVDHHTVPDDAAAHPAHALINPLRADSTFPFRSMASVGLAFYLAARLRTVLAEAGHFTSELPAPDVREMLDLVAVGTIADLVPLVGENRILTTAGLRVASRRKRHGLAALLHMAGVDRDVDEHVVGWKISPRLNAPGRLGDAAPSLSLLLSRDAHEAQQWAAELENANDRRREIQAQVFEHAMELAGDPNGASAVVVAAEGWPSGVVGIVAAKLVDEFQRPAFVIAIEPATGEGRGSARSVAGVNLYEALHSCRDVLVRYGGHAGAAGLTVARDHIDALREGLQAAVRAQLGDGAQPGDDDALLVDSEVALAEVDQGLAEELARLAPFGKENPAPLLLCRGVRVRKSRLVGEDRSHLKLELEDDEGNLRGGIAFGAAELDPGEGALIDVVFVPEISEWQGTRRVDLKIQRLVCAKPQP